MTGNYWVVNQILQKNLHHADEACLQYTTKLMDKLEKVMPTSILIGCHTHAQFTVQSRKWGE